MGCGCQGWPPIIFRVKRSHYSLVKAIPIAGTNPMPAHLNKGEARVWPRPKFFKVR